MPGPFDGAPRRRPRPRPPRARGRRRAAWCWCCTAARHTASNPSAPAAARSGGCRCCATRCGATSSAAGHALWLLRYARRGWNGGTTRGPVPDARWALDQVRAAYGDVPVVLVGHSMGARVASRVADDPNVRGVVGLAPWFDARRPGRRTGRQGPRGRVTACATGSPRPAAAGRSPSAPRPSPPAPSSTRSGAPVTTCSTGRRRWNRFALRHSLDVLARAEDRSDTVE